MSRQDVLYKDLVDIYRPVHTTGTSSIGAVKEPLYELLYADARAKYNPNKNTSILNNTGRLEKGSKDELEEFYFDSDKTIRDQYCIKLKTPGHPNENQWYTVIGDPEVRAKTGKRKANYIHANVRTRVLAPTIRP